jgi:hypothetical protein
MLKLIVNTSPVNAGTFRAKVEIWRSAYQPENAQQKRNNKTGDKGNAKLFGDC